MNNVQFEKIFEDQVAFCERMLLQKGHEYAIDSDRMHNFKVAASFQGETPKGALGGMLAKHIVSIFDMIRSETESPMEKWEEKIGDAMNYLFLLKALVLEEHGLVPPINNTTNTIINIPVTSKRIKNA